MDSKKAFFSCLKVEFAPLLRQFGFKGSGQHFRRIRGEVIHAIFIQVNKYGGSCCVELGLHLSFLPLTSGKEPVDLKKIRAISCEFRQRLTPPGYTDFWWGFGENSPLVSPMQKPGTSGHSPEERARHLIQTYFDYGEPLYQKLSTVEEVSQLIRLEDITQRRYPLPMYRYTQVRAALAMAQIHLYLGNVKMAKQFAEAGLQVGEPRALKKTLEAILEAT